MGIGVNIKNKLTEKGWTVAELSRISSVQPQTLYAIIKRDNKKVDIGILSKIADAFQCGLNELVADENSRSREIIKREEAAVHFWNTRVETLKCKLENIDENASEWESVNHELEIAENMLRNSALDLNDDLSEIDEPNSLSEKETLIQFIQYQAEYQDITGPYNQLNKTGKQEAVKRVTELTYIPEYKKED